jgi:GT2 family glycosyltransferase
VSATSLVNIKPKFSIVIPTYARPRQLKMCLSEVGRLDYPREGFETIVVDDGSPEPVDEVVASFHSALELRLIRQANRGPAAARNTGAKAAAGQYLVFTDDDCLPDPRWLRELDRVFAEEPHCLVGGSIVNASPDNPFSTATQAIMTAVYGYYDRHPDRKRFFSTSNLAAPTACFHQLGGFCESFSLASGEDYDFCDRWQHSGRAIWHAPRAIVSHAHLLTLGSFCRQHFNYGRGLLQFRARAARRAGRTIRGERLGFYLHLLTYPLGQWPGWRGWQYTGLVALSQAATLAGACRELLARSIAAVSMPDIRKSSGQ